MALFVLQRLLQTVPVLFLTSVAVFAMLRAIPGDPAVTLGGIDATPETLAAIRHDLALDQPLPLQYVTWLEHVLQGDLGRSTTARRPVTDLLGVALPATLQLVVGSMAVGVLLGGGVGILSAVFRGTWIDLAAGVVNALLVGIPTFWLGLLAIIVFALILGWLPPGGRVDLAQNPGLALRTMLLPTAVLGLAQAAIIARFTRAAMLEVLGDAYIRTARAKGLAPATVVLRHAMRNALIPVLTVIGVQTGHLIGGAVVVETVFAWPGMGRLVVGAIAERDYPTVQAVLLVLVCVFVLVNLVTDLLYGYVDPRMRVAS